MSILFKTDSYKFSQFKQYPANTTHINSYIEARGGAEESMFFGLQAFVKEYLTKQVTQKDIDFYGPMVEAHGEPFNYKGWQYIVDNHNGYLPISIEAVPEGTVMSTGNIQVNVVNTDSKAAWLTSYLETSILRGIWYPSSVATKSFMAKRYIKNALEITSDTPVDEQLAFKLHDFGARGATSGESAALGGMGHLVNFLGTDTFEAVVAARKYYNESVAGFSIPASEHSSITSWGKDREKEAYENMLDQFSGPGKIVACVSDSYNIYHAVKYIWGKELKERVESTGGTLVIRPDSGDPLVVPMEVIELLMDIFGFTINSKGYKVLPPYVRVIQGDGINADSLRHILDIMETKKLSAENIAFGMGGGLLQDTNRDDLKYAMKASARQDSNGVWHDIFKDPIHGGKKSKPGLLQLYKIQEPFGKVKWITMSKKHTAPLWSTAMLREVFRNGKLLIDENFSTIRERANRYV